MDRPCGDLAFFDVPYSTNADYASLTPKFGNVLVVVERIVLLERHDLPTVPAVLVVLKAVRLLPPQPLAFAQLLPYLAGADGANEIKTCLL